MPAVLNTNAASLYASKNLQSAQTKMADSVERLSSQIVHPLLLLLIQRLHQKA